MEQGANFYYMLAATVFLSVGLSIFMAMYGSSANYSDAVKAYELRNPIVEEVYDYNPNTVLFTREEIIGLLMSPREYDMIVDGIYFDRATFDFAEFDFWTVQDKNYRKVIEYNGDGSIGRIVFS